MSGSDVLDRAVSMIERSQRAFEHGRIEEAVELLERAVALDGDPRVSAAMIDYVYRHTGPWSRAGDGPARRPIATPRGRGTRTGSSSPARRSGGGAWRR